jgi:hypothetical protein
MTYVGVDEADLKLVECRLHQQTDVLPAVVAAVRRRT